MLRLRSDKGVRFCDGLTRRDFMRVGALAAGSVGLTLADLGAARAASSRAGDVNCILLFLVGGPSQLDTWDMKPHAAANIRGPFRPIQTNVAGIQICEHFPRMAALADKYAIVRSVHHRAAPIHETGHQLMQTGRLFRGGEEHPHYGAVVSHLRGPRVPGMPPFAVVPRPIGNTGVSISHGQGAGYLGARHEPCVLRGIPSGDGMRITEISPPAGLDPARLHSRHDLICAIDDAERAFDSHSEREYDRAFNVLFAQRTRRAYDLAAEHDALRDRYGRNTFGQSCLLGRRLIEHGVRLVTVNMFDTVFNEITWDCHADGGALGTTLDDYRRTLCPMFDVAYTALLEDLQQRGLLESTLVVAMGEFGRTPQLNPRGGRDHWPGVWSILFAGAGVRGGQVIGSSDRTGSEPRQRPVTPAEVAASVYRGLSIDATPVRTGAENRPVPIVEAPPLSELFRG